MKKEDNEFINHSQFPSEFEPDPDCYVVFATNGLKLGRMIAPSKSEYCKEHQGDLVIFNANVITKKYGKIWYGDLNVSLDFDSLKNVADSIGEDLYILMEGDARFGYEKAPIDELIAKSKAVIRCNVKLQTEKKFKKKRKSSRKTKKDGIDN